MLSKENRGQMYDVIGKLYNYMYIVYIDWRFILTGKARIK